MKKIWDNIKSMSSWILAIAIIILVIVPYIIIFFYLRKQNKTITIFPELKIKEITNKNEIDPDVLSNSINIGKQIITRMTQK